MEVVAAGEDVRAGEAAEGEVCAVCTAADGLHHGFDAGFFHSLHGAFNHVEHGFHHFTHVVVLVFDFAGEAVVVFHVEIVRDLLDLLFFGFKFSAVVIADDVVELAGFISPPCGAVFFVHKLSLKRVFFKRKRVISIVMIECIDK